MLYKLGSTIKTGLTNLKDFYTKNKKEIYLSLFMLSFHPHYCKFTFNNDENSNKIENFLTWEEANERKNSLSNISYQVFFDFSNEENLKEKNLLFKINGKVIISFDFVAENFPGNKKYLKLDYQGKVISVYLNDRQLQVKEDFYVNESETKENFVIQEKNCVFVNKNILKKKNKLLIEFSSEYSEEFKCKEINNPFLLMEQLNESNKQKAFKVS